MADTVTTTATILDIEPADIVKLLEQYLRENNLFKTLKALQEETSVSLNTVDSIEIFVNDIQSGHWDVVLKAVKLLKLPDDKLIDLYEQIAIEIIELGETRAANWMIHKTDPMLKMKQQHTDRYLHLQNLLGRSFFDHKEAYRGGKTKEIRRSEIAQDLKKEVSVVPPQRLLKLISDALKWQKHEGLLPPTTAINIFTGKAHMIQVEEETYPNTLHKHCIKPIKSPIDDLDQIQIFVTCSDFTPDGQYMIVGYSTGLIEIRNPTTGRLSNDLKYQAHKSYIVTPSKTAALSLCFNSNDLMAVGDKLGDISLWKIETGQLVQLFKAAHLKGVSCLLFCRNGSEILSGGLDHKVKLHGLRSNKTLRIFEGHKHNVNSIAISKDGHHIVSGGSDSTVKIWNAKTAHKLGEFKNQAKIHTVLAMPNFKDDTFLVADKLGCIQLLNLGAEVKQRFSIDASQKQSIPDESAKKEDKDNVESNASFFTICLSPKGNYIYAVDSRYIYCVNYSTKKLEKKLTVHEDTGNDLIGIKHHPLLNLVATYDTLGNLKLWKP